MRSIKVTRTYDPERVTSPCLVRDGVMVGSVVCQNCLDFKGYDEGKGTRVLCSSEYQVGGQRV